ncbi:hypothetical protein [Methylocapsa palsarum]|uniref:Uncharacterized protein n=1 Tax=Methylocapsa palsarum TaxID=1612308 RepID=A0A1I3YSP4_9HYPH|nr:hypothetical protein [Methylocapsa palsarum]SFK34226.1 hypothetical protein SAMN05444581_106115 [Methylocapsa palsarum]
MIFRSLQFALAFALLTVGAVRAQAFPPYPPAQSYPLAMGRNPPILLMTEGCLFGWRRDAWGVCWPYPDAGFSSGNCWYESTPYGHRRVCRWW